MTLDEIAVLTRWVEGGGVIITDLDASISPLSGDWTAFGEFFEEASKSESGFEVREIGSGRTAVWPGSVTLNGTRHDERWADDHPDHPATDPVFWDDLVALLRGFSALGDGFADLLIPDGERDEVYATSFSDGILFYNQSDEDVIKSVQDLDGATHTITVPAGDMAELSINIV